MIRLLSKYRLLATAIFVLAAFLFWFTYSEIGQYTVEKQHPPAQDYCKVVRVIKTEIGKTAASSLSKLKFEKTICMRYINETSIQNAAVINFEIVHFYKAQKTTPIYLYNSTLLI